VAGRDGRALSRGGRPSNVIGLSDSLRFLGINAGTTSISVAITDGYLRVLESMEEPVDLGSGPEAVLEQVIRYARHICRASSRSLPVSGAGLALPSPVSFAEGRPAAPPLMPGWHDFPVRDRLAAAIGVPVTVDNDANVLALGEQHSGAARGIADFLAVKLGTGLGCGIVVNGELYRGRDGCAGDIGHIAAGDPMVLCHCGRMGCLEAQFGGTALARKATASAQSGESPLLASRLADNGSLSAEDVAWASMAGDPGSTRLIRAGGRQLGEVLAALVNFYNPEMIVIGGPLADLGPTLLAEIRSVILDRATPLATINLSVVMSSLGKTAGLIGAAHLASDTFIQTLSLPDQMSPAAR
jgi:glucokinase-like ROK family protein